MRRCLQIISCLILFACGSYAQQPAYFMFGQEQFEGIDIYNIIQDHQHNYWFATDQGIYMHDGYKFEKIECAEMNTNSVFNFVINSKGIIYCSNLSQQIFQIKNGKCSLIFTIPDKGMDITICINNKDELYISTSKKIYILDSTNKLIHSPDIKDGNSLSPPQLLSDGSIIQHVSASSNVFFYKNGNFRTRSLVFPNGQKFSHQIFNFLNISLKTFAIDNQKNELYSYDLSTNVLNKIPINLTNEKVYLRHYTIDNKLWVSDNFSGVTVFDNEFKQTASHKKIFNDYFISYIFKDHEGNILLATFDEGVIVIPDIRISDIDPIFSDYKVTRMTKGNDSELFFGTRDGQILKYNGKVELISNSSNKSVESIFYWSANKIILEDTKSLTIHFDQFRSSSLNYGSMKDLVFTKPNEVFFALNAGVYSATYDPKERTFTKSDAYFLDRSYIIEKEKNNLYVSTASGLKFSSNYKTFRSLTNKGKIIHALAIEENNGFTYIASAKQGILIYQNGELIKQLHPNYNGEELTIFKFIIHNKQLYANTQFGLLILNFEGKIIHCLNKSTGLTANKIIDFEIFQNQLWITHSRGIQHFDLNSITTKVKKPQIILSEIKINNKALINTLRQGSFTSKERNLTFVFKSSTLKHRENIRYHYNLEGNNKEWVINTYENNQVTYNALSPGVYKFIVKAENNGVFSNPITYSFKISAPYYQRWWFIGLIILLVLLIVSLIYLRQLNIHKKKAKQINELNASRLTAIQSQMNPHFIFNSLNSIQDLVLKGDIDNSYTFITKFSNLVRRTLSYSDKDFIDFEQEIKLIELYLSLEKLRFKEDLNYTIETNGIDDIKIPPMLIQPFIENALVHGLLHKEGLKKLRVGFKLTDVLICEIEDNGIGREKAQEIKERQGSNHESFAVNAIKRRISILKDHFDGKLGFESIDIIKDSKVVGTKVILRIPIQQKF